MPHWLIKSAIQRVISLLPASHKWNELFQTYGTRSLELTEQRFEHRLNACCRHWEALRSRREISESKLKIFEIGTGWYPVVQTGYFLCGAADVWSFDISPLLETKRLTRMLALFSEYAADGRLPRFLPGVRRDRLEHLNKLLPQAPLLRPEKILERMNIHALVRPAQHSQLPSGTIDFFSSTGVLEYIPREELKSILLECKRLSAPNAIHSHYVNLVDQFSYFDSSITPFNFLRYSARAWKYLNSPLTWQNRFRVSDFRSAFAESGYRIVGETNTTGSVSDLEKVRLAPEFQSYSKEDLLVLHSWLVAELA